MLPELLQGTITLLNVFNLLPLTLFLFTLVAITWKLLLKPALESKIAFTPTIFLNGYEMPKAYSVNDLPGLINGLITKEEQGKITETENELVTV